MEKRTIRSEMKALRAVNYDTHAALSTIIADRFLKNETFLSYPSYFVYYSTEDEVGTRTIISALLDLGKRVFVPRSEKTGVVAVEIDRDTKFNAGAFGILEPIGDVFRDDIAFAVVPMVAFDRKFNRLGHGKGLYDGFLKDFKGYKLGLAFEYQHVSAIDAEAFDVKMDAVLTEKTLYRSVREGI